MAIQLISDILSDYNLTLSWKTCQYIFICMQKQEVADGQALFFNVLVLIWLPLSWHNTDTFVCDVPETVVQHKLRYAEIHHCRYELLQG